MKPTLRTQLTALPWELRVSALFALLTMAMFASQNADRTNMELIVLLVILFAGIVQAHYRLTAFIAPETSLQATHCTQRPTETAPVPQASTTIPLPTRARPATHFAQSASDPQTETA